MALHEASFCKSVAYYWSRMELHFEISQSWSGKLKGHLMYVWLVNISGEEHGRVLCKLIY